MRAAVDAKKNRPGDGSDDDSDWRYCPSEHRRDLRLDLLRGLCLFKMVFDHLWHTPLHKYGLWIGYVSAAEGFFFISGVVVGIVHGRRMFDNGLRTTSRSLLTRALNLYLANLALVLGFASLESAGLIPGRGFFRMWQPSFHWLGVFELNQPYYLQVLPRYSVFLAFTPLALWCLRNHRTAWVAAVSLAGYGLNLALGGTLCRHMPATFGSFYFPLAPWQLLFFAGLILGFHRQRLVSWWRSRSTARWMMAMIVLCLAFALLRRGFELAIIDLPPGWESGLFGRGHLGIGRLLNLMPVFTLCFLASDRLFKPLSRVFGPVLVPFGQHSLYFFLMHIPMRWLGNGVLVVWPVAHVIGPWRFLILDIAIMALLLLMIRRRFLFGFVPS